MRLKKEKRLIPYVPSKADRTHKDQINRKKNLNSNSMNAKLIKLKAAAALGTIMS